MSEYVNGIRINLTDVVRIEFIDINQNGMTLIHSIAMNYDTFKNLRDAVTSVIERHKEKLSKLN